MDTRLVAARLPALALYGSPYASQNFPGYLPYGPAAGLMTPTADPAALYSALGPGENVDAWRAGLSQAAATAAYYDPALVAHYGYGYGPMGLSDGARRKNATRETTSTLKAWLNDHRKNPYPTKAEKVMLAIVTKMTLTQVSTWFANARRRLKKENKMTWSPRNRCGEDDEDDDDDLPEDNLHHQGNHNSRSSSPLVSDVTRNNFSSRESERPRLNGHTSGGESLSDEGMSYLDKKDSIRMSTGRSDTEANERKENKSSDLVARPSSKSGVEESKMRSMSSHLTRTHPYATSRSSPAFAGLHSNLSPSVQSPISRSGLSFPTALHPHLAGGVQQSPMLHSGLPGQFNPAAAASFFAASRGHPLPPSLIAALNEQAQMHHYQQAFQLPFHSFLTSPSDAINSTAKNNPFPSPNSSPRVSCNSSPATTRSNTSPVVKSPTKPKIWSLADVAKSADNSKPTYKAENTEHAKTISKNEVEMSSEEYQNKSTPNVSWMESIFQKNLAAAMSGQNIHSGSMLPSHFQHLANGFRANTQTETLPQIRLPFSYTGLADFMTTQEAQTATKREVDRNHNASRQETTDKTPLPSSNRSPDSHAEQNNRHVSSPAVCKKMDDVSESKNK